MMTGIKDFFDELKIRVANPLISSFIISWLICNWKIVILLLFYRTDDFPVDGSTSFIDYISDNYNFLVTIFLPAVGSIAYTAGSPFVSAKVKLFYAEISAKNQSDILESTNERSMPMSKYIKQMKDINEQKMEIQELAAVEGQTKLQMEEVKRENASLMNSLIALKGEVELERESGNTVKRMLDTSVEHSEILKTENSNLKVDLEDTRIENEKLQNLLESWNRYNSFNILNGRWRFETEVSDKDAIFSPKQVITIKDGSIYFGSFQGRITDIAGNYNDKKVSFVINRSRGDFSEVTEAYFLRYDKKDEKLYGLRNGEDKVSFFRHVNKASSVD